MATNKSQLPASVKLLADRRKGGEYNLHGIEYQLRYSICKALTVLEQSQQTMLRLEGIEDVDVLHQRGEGSLQLYQLKHTTSKIQANHFTKWGLLQNFLEAYLLEPSAEFILVTNQAPSDINVAAFQNSQFNEQIIAFWQNKIEEIRMTDKRATSWAWSNYNTNDFLNKIQLIIVSEQEIKAQTDRLIVNRFDVNNKTEANYLDALFYYFFVTARQKGTITYQNIEAVIEQVKNFVAKGVINLAIQQKWLELIEFKQDLNKDLSSYFDGKAALPAHIALGLPVTRQKTEQAILDHLLKYDCAIIRASSGQGKSTLGWMVSKTLSDNQTHKIYQLHHCPTTESVGSIVDFLQSAIKASGKIPLVIIDGLSVATAAWTELAGRMIEEPIKFIITTRQEDWFRFGREAYKVNLGQPIDLKFTDIEAKYIYTELKRRKKIYSDTIHWQRSWEKVKDSGLLIEYVYLLTRGEMLQDRLRDQTQKLGEEVDGALKLHILRMISFADISGVRIQIFRLLDKISQHDPSPQTDLGLMLEQLEKEYSLRFDEEYVEGLHPVRSAHLSTLLHKYVPYSKTLINLFDVVDSHQLYQLSIEIPLRIRAHEELTFYQSLADKLIKVESSHTVSVLFGLYHGEIIRYWQKHQDTFDSVFDQGSFMLLPMMTMPFPHPKSNLSDLLADMLKGNAQHLISAAKELPPLTIQQTSLGKLMPLLCERINLIEQPDSHAGQLLRWFHLFNISVPLPSDLQLLGYLSELDSETGAELAEAVFTTHPAEFRQFSRSHLDLIISWLKIKTNTLTITPDDDKIIIEYLLTDKLADQANDESVQRIEVVRAWLPLYEVYETNAIMLPFPNEQLISVVKQNAHKAMPNTNIISSFTVRLNQIWWDTLERQYVADSVYFWQKQWMDLRQYALECVRLSCRIMELQLMRQSSDKIFSKAIEGLEQASMLFLNTDKTIRQFPVNQITAEERITPFKEEVSKMRDWSRAFSNFLNQFTGLFVIDKPDVRHLALINLRSTMYFLPLMQDRFDYVVANTWEYFITETLKQDEILSYRRIQRTAIFYAEHVQRSTFPVVLEVHKTVKDKWEEKQAGRLRILNLVLDNLEEMTGRTVYHPVHIIEEELLSNAVFGMEILDVKNAESNLEYLLINLSVLADSDFDFITIVFCQQSIAKSALRFNRSILQLADKTLRGEDITVEEFNAPHPVIPNRELLMPLPDVSFHEGILEEDVEAVTKIIIAVWKVAEFKSRLSSNQSVQKEWLDSQLISLKKEIDSQLTIIKNVFGN
ncbi:dsDNA nuclease domain-containing protein [Spirosoma foliorum]|uniref:DUF4297 domain-containing protein n=1 Tax=Spirosoma foliorum TaxID=2710596 RepID=A0A7G5GX89_9BACT|nr:dsDNA nuclease domain-containing protein [Spirosoma foliorum]QMW03481.1 DUF4297 domain-containing protein [Spirosoma foliorum]